jgi:hypothetical protein
MGIIPYAILKTIEVLIILSAIFFPLVWFGDWLEKRKH